METAVFAFVLVCIAIIAICFIGFIFSLIGLARHPRRQGFSLRRKSRRGRKRGGWLM